MFKFIGSIINSIRASFINSSIDKIKAKILKLDMSSDKVYNSLITQLAEANASKDAKTAEGLARISEIQDKITEYTLDFKAKLVAQLQDLEKKLTDLN